MSHFSSLVCTCMQMFSKHNQANYNIYATCGPCKCVHTDSSMLKGSTFTTEPFKSVQWGRVMYLALFSDKAAQSALHSGSSLSCCLLFMQHKINTGTRKVIWHKTARHFLLTEKYAIVSKPIWVLISGLLYLSVYDSSMTHYMIGTISNRKS